MPHLSHTVLVFLLFCVSCLATLPQLTVSRGKITTSNTHTPFIPRGANYIRLNASQGGASPTDPTHPVYHSTFSPRLFNATQAQARLAQLHAQGYNIVRCFVDHGDPTRHDGVVLGNYLSPRYMDNVATFVRLASRFHMYTIPTLELFPSYVPRYNCNASVLDQQLFPYPNAALFVAGCVRAKRQYGIDFLFELKQRLGSLSSIGMVLIENELSVSVGAAPFLATPAGSVRPANNQTYDLSNSSQRLGLVEDSGRFWSTSVRTGLRSIDPNVLVGVGMFTFAAVSGLVVVVVRLQLWGVPIKPRKNFVFVPGTHPCLILFARWGALLPRPNSFHRATPPPKTAAYHPVLPLSNMPWTCWTCTCIKAQVGQACPLIWTVQIGKVCLDLPHPSSWVSLVRFELNPPCLRLRRRRRWRW